MSKLKKIQTIIFIWVVSFLIPKAVFAASGPKGNCSSDTAIDTAIGCVPYGSMQELAGFFLTWAIGIGGGIAFLFIIYASFLITTSSGDPKKAQAGRELLTSAISGLVLLLFAVFILNIVGVSIFGIAEFTK